MNIKKREIAAYALTPQVFPRFKELITGGFSWLAYLIAHIYYAVRLLPESHPYLNSDNKGKYGIKHVIAAAARNLKFELKYIDQLLIFGLIMVGIVILISQIFLVLTGFILSQASAGMFETLNPESDNAFMLLDFVFGVPGFFGSCALGTDDPANATIAPCIAGSIPAWGAAPVFAYHAGLHSMLEFYSWSLLFVGILIFLYFIVIVLGETARTGVPFGARFNTAWAPIRLLVAIGLLLPIAYGLNSGQYLTLAIAKLGSGLATNGWLAYNTTVATSFAARGSTGPAPSGYDASHTGGTSSNEALLPRPQNSDASPFVATMMLVKACEYAYMKRYGFTNRTETTADGPETYQHIRPWIVKPGADPIPLMNAANNAFDGVNVGAGTPPTFTGGAGGNPFDGYDNVLQYYDYGDVVIRFGAPQPDVPPPAGNYDPNTIVPYCGEVTLTTSTAVPILSGGDPAGAWHMQKAYFELLFELWEDDTYRAHAARWAETQSTGFGLHRPCSIPQATLPANTGITQANVLTILGTTTHNFGPPTTPPDECTLPPPQSEQTSLVLDMQVDMAAQINTAWIELLTVPDLYDLTTEVEERGWAAAGMWYNNLATVIGREFDAVANTPYLSRMPAVMAEVRRLRGSSDFNVSAIEVYNPLGASNEETLNEVMIDRDVDIAKTLYHVHKSWQTGGIDSFDLSIAGDTNIMTSVMHGIFGTERLMSILEEESFEVHPMAQLIAIGKDLVNSTLVNVMLSVGFSVGSGIFQASGQGASYQLAEALSGAFSAIALVGLTAGFLLYYVLPFMPFLYFFFAVGTWVKTIFEAMVGVPLWALAHIRIDREGLPGDAAANGYFLLLEIFVRPILIVFALIASFIIFGALVRVLHEVWSLVITNVMGFDESEPARVVAPFNVSLLTDQFRRNIIDEFFFTLIYVMTVYMIGLSCFKLIDQIPQSILRWAGAGVSSFGDKYEDPAGSLTQYAAIGGYLVGRQAIDGMRSGGKAFGQLQSRLTGNRGMTNPIFPNERNLMRGPRSPATPPPSDG